MRAHAADGAASLLVLPGLAALFTWGSDFRGKVRSVLGSVLQSIP